MSNILATSKAMYPPAQNGMHASKSPLWTGVRGAAVLHFCRATRVSVATQPRSNVAEQSPLLSSSSSCWPLREGFFRGSPSKASAHSRNGKARSWIPVKLGVSIHSRCWIRSSSTVTAIL